MRADRIARPVRRGRLVRGAPALALGVLGLALLTGCAGTGPSAQQSRAGDPDTVDCAVGGRAISGLQNTFRGLSDQLNGIGPASARGDLADVKNRVGQGMRLAAQVPASIQPATATMNSPLIRSAYQDVGQAGARLHDALGDLNAALDSGRPAQGVTDSLSAALDSLNGAMNRMRVACSSVFPEPAARIQTVQQVGS
ncbi:MULTISPECIES: hypothetical protein [unclassified Nocardia]|uniref:hypothetical protein n=1 Tax=unclassified Nocardia TaxID=2637762 RepID=UPI001CE3D2A8|nr:MULTISPECIES: hypothetical protein [unclassified Nocardia]